MRSPGRKRPTRRNFAKIDRQILDALASRVSYVGSPEHKDGPSFAGHPRPRADASICDRRFLSMQDELTLWLREAIQRGAVSELFEGDFPRYVWVRREGIVYEARLVNRELGHYKGYALSESEWPQGIEEVYG